MRKKNLYLFAVLAVCLLLALGGVRAARSAPALSIDRWVVATGGGTSASGSFSLSGTAGQVEAGSALTGGSFRLTSGFWFAGWNSLFMPLILRE
jgi:hypothetical protein